MFWDYEKKTMYSGLYLFNLLYVYVSFGLLHRPQHTDMYGVTQLMIK